jgi:TRAP-type transport system periplasmic protein
MMHETASSCDKIFRKEVMRPLYGTDSLHYNTFNRHKELDRDILWEACMIFRSICAAFLTLTLVPATTVGPAQSADVFELKVSHYLPPNHTFQKELVRWGEELEKASGGRLKLRIYPASQLGPVNRQFDLVRNGVADIAVGLHGATPGRFPVSDLVSLPYVRPSAGSLSEVTSYRLTELAPKYLAAEHPGMKILWMAVTNPLLVHTTKIPLKSVDDLKGLRIRYAGEQFAAIISMLNAVPLAVPPGETQDALAKGIIDGCTFPYEAAQSFDLGTVAKYSQEPGVMNQRKFDGLPADLREIIEMTTGVAQAGRFGAAFDAAEKAGRDYMISKGVQITTLTPEEFAKIKTRLEPITVKSIEEVEKQGKPAKAFLADYQR